MRLLKASTCELEEFPPNRIPPYAIVSHTWETQEVTFDDLQRSTGKSKNESWRKVQISCQCTIRDGLEYVWIDTCCVNKDSSAELSETLNSMYSWYRNARACYVYLADVPAAGDPSQPGSAFENSKWFTRGWTLQELLAPTEMLFFSREWTEIGRKSINEKDTLCSALSKITRIDEDILMHRKPLGSISVARRMAWVAHRETTRPEDIAYCLMGVFSVNMPMLYGEGGEKAFLRLQEEIMKQSDDQTIFAWVDRDAPKTSLHGLLATSPSHFAGCHNIFPYQDWAPRQPYSMTNRGLRIELPITRYGTDEYVAVLECPSPPLYRDTSFLAIFLKRLSAVDGQYARIKVDRLAEVHERGLMQTIYVRQHIVLPDLGGIFPNHILQLRGMPGPGNGYQIIDVLAPDEAEHPRGLMYSGGGTSDSRLFRTFRITKGLRNHLLCAFIFQRMDGPALMVMLGSEEEFAVGFDAIDAQEPDRFNADDLKTISQIYQPKKLGNWITLDHHRVCVNAHPRIYESTKYYVADINIQDADKPSHPVAAISEALESLHLEIRPAIRPLKKPEIKPEHKVQPQEKSKSAFGLRLLFRDN